MEGLLEAEREIRIWQMRFTEGMLLRKVRVRIRVRKGKELSQFEVSGKL